MGRAQLFQVKISGRSLDLIIVAVSVFLLRIWVVGNPHIHVDEEFYLLVGGRMLDGALPYIDIWDRKPIGLFLIYAFAALFGDGVVAYQILAMLFVCATSAIIYSMSRTFADRRTSVLAAISYAILLNFFEGMGGQAPVFFNLFVTGAAWLLMKLYVDQDDAPSRLLKNGSIAMALMGLAIQVKYSALGEAILFGLFLQYIALERHGVSRALGFGMIWATFALLPTFLAYLFYWHLNAGSLFIHANFTSTLDRGSDPPEWVRCRLFNIIKILLTPSATGLWCCWLQMRKVGSRFTPHQQFILFWNVAAWFTFLAFGTFFPHYALPLAAPTALLFAFASGKWFEIRALIVAVSAVISVDTVHREVGAGGGAAVIRSTLAAMGPSRNCPYMYEGSPIIYHLGHYCLPSRYAFPYHLSIVREHDALGVDADAELARILSRNPEYIVVRLPFSPEHRKASDAMVARTLRQRYRFVMATRQWYTYSVALFQLKPGYLALPNDAKFVNYTLR